MMLVLRVMCYIHFTYLHIGTYFYFISIYIGADDKGNKILRDTTKGEVPSQ